MTWPSTTTPGTTDRLAGSRRGYEETDHLRRRGPGEVVALGAVATKPPDELEGGGVLDSLGDHAEAEAPGELDGAGEQPAVAVRVVRDESAVELHAVEGEIL